MSMVELYKSGVAQTICELYGQSTKVVDVAKEVGLSPLETRRILVEEAVLSPSNPYLLEVLAKEPEQWVEQLMEYQDMDIERFREAAHNILDAVESILGKDGTWY